MSQGFTKPLTLPLAVTQGGTGTTGSGILDANGNEILGFTSVASSVNYFNIINNITGSAPTLQAIGDDANVSLGFVFKGSGVFAFFGNPGNPSICDYYEDAANGSNKIRVATPAAISADQTVTWKSASSGYPVLDSINSDVWTDFSGSVGFTGFSANPTSVTAFYKKIGNTCFIQITMTAGTSNATSFTITGLPFTSVTGRSQVSPYLFAINNSTSTSLARASIASASTTITMANGDGGGSGWTAAGTKGTLFSIFYETA